ncbi:MAG TPA: aminotransferase class III-fold pyridoxal phosphate-dependent enzyme, partial [Armatimonadaceae bacterium]|nr:aminotransferase class III-fold pyridoxal phosphate-dependent enzyme [Armatimonadaceae bacterium]
DLAAVERTLQRQGDSVAAIITEPVMCNNGCIPPGPGYLEGLRALCDHYGCLLIFDEVITGFRLGLSGAQGYYGVTPDLAVFGKAMASGYPISVLAGREKYLRLLAEGTVIHAGTMNSGNPSVAAALATLEVLERDDVHARLHRLGARLRDGLRAAARDAGQPLRVQGPGPMFHAGFALPGREDAPVRDLRGALDAYDRPKYAAFVAEMQERGVRLIGRGLWYVSAAHTEGEIEHAVETAREVLEGMEREA